jgi:DNA invertase Pin-like site-specific DNA recombinase
MRVYGYVRGNTDSAEHQRDAIRALAAIVGHDVDAFFIDYGVSGNVPIWRRTSGKLLDERVESGDIIYVWSMDRISRMVEFRSATIQRFAEKGVTVRAVENLVRAALGEGQTLATLGHALMMLDRQTA